MAKRLFGRRRTPAQTTTWDDDPERPRVLIEHSDPTELAVVAQLLTEAGYGVATCEGPSVSPRAECTMATADECPLVEEADLVFHGLRVSEEVNREVLSSIRRRYPGTPVIVEAAGPALDRYADELEGMATVRYPSTSAAILDAVSAELGTSPAH